MRITHTQDGRKAITFAALVATGDGRGYELLTCTKVKGATTTTERTRTGETFRSWDAAVAEMNRRNGLS